jgi:cation diffusion facilitator family transporter
MTETALAQQTREKNFVAASSVAAAIFLTTFKTIVGLATGSLGILAEAAHSGLDLVAALITLFAVRLSDRPADQTHPYGHGKVENLSALVETLLLLVTCIWIIYEAINRLFFHAVHVEPSFWAFLIMCMSIVIDLTRSRALYRVAKKYASQALEADALHFSTDIWSSSVVIIGLTLVLIGDLTGQTTLLAKSDALAALVVALIVIYVSMKLGQRTIDALLDRAPEGLAQEIAKAASSPQDVVEVTRIRVRQVGNQTFVDLRISVPRHLSFEESHAVTREVQNSVRAIVPNADVVVHAIPVAENEGVMEKVIAIAARGHYAVHHITTHWTKRGMWIDLDLEVDPDTTFERAHAMATDLEMRLRTHLASVQRIADVNVHVEPRDPALVQGVEVAPRDARQYTERIEAIQRSVPHTRGVQDIELQQLNAQVYLSFHLLIDRDQTVTEVHRIAEEVENRLRRDLPQLGRVVIHTEPYAKNKK